MGILEVVKSRRSIREFRQAPIEKSKIEKLIEALIWAPSAGNLQSRKFYFVFKESIKEQLAQSALNQTFIKKAPLVIVACGNFEIEKRYGKRGKKLYMICDVSASIQNLMLVAWEESLGTCWVGAFDEDSVKRILNLPKNLTPIAIIPVGYPAKIPPPPPRKEKGSLIEIVK